MSGTDPSRETTVAVRGLGLGDRFGDDGRCWRVSYVDDTYIEATESQFSTIRTYYDPLTADKAGEFSWNREVTPL